MLNKNCLNCIHLKKNNFSYPISIIGNGFYCIVINNIIYSTRRLIFSERFLKYFRCSFYKLRNNNEK